VRRLRPRISLCGQVAIYRYPLRSSATDILNRYMKTGVADHALADLAMSLREDGHLSIVEDDEEHDSVTQIIPSKLFEYYFIQELPPKSELHQNSLRGTIKMETKSNHISVNT
jgi:hypothetical protein